MKKVIPFITAAAMILSMGTTAFADISYGSSGSENVSLEEVSLSFEGDLVITNSDDEVVTRDEFRPGDTIYMPLYGESERYTETVVGHVDAEDVTLALDSSVTSTAHGDWQTKDITDENSANVFYQGLENVFTNDAGETLEKVVYKGVSRTYTIVSADADAGAATVKVHFDEIEGTVQGSTETSYGPYTGKVGKNWSINFVEKSDNFVDNAAFYKARAKDSYLEEGAWYIKVDLKPIFDSVKEDEVYFRVYVADKNSKATTNKVYVKGTYANEVVKYVDFEWTNNANTPLVWQVAKGDKGEAIFDFYDEAFFKVKMQGGEKIYLNLDTSYQNKVADKNNVEAEYFYNFVGTHSNFKRTGELVLVSNDPNMTVFEIDSNGYMHKVDAEYVEKYYIAHTGERVSGYVFQTNELGNYAVVPNSELDNMVEDEDNSEEDKNENNETSVTPSKPSTDKENPNTGVDNGVASAAALGILSVAAAGALAMKK